MPMSMSLEQQVAQRLIVGYPGLTPNAALQSLVKAGLGGVIFFRDNFQDGQDSSGVLSPLAVARQLSALQQALPVGVPPAFLSIDQEGGQVERLPHTIFPSTVTPRAVAQTPDPVAFARRVYGVMGRYLALLGFNMNFFPTLDVNLEPKNPIIGVRAFGDSPEVVWPLAQAAMESYHAHGIVTVGKHFPGHGNGTVDSHKTLPWLNFTEAELTPFHQAVQGGVPAMMVSHGFYPALQTAPDEFEQPASASPTIIRGLLRGRLGYSGVVMSDDMVMGAITQNRDPVEAAVKALEAGVDMLIYRHATDELLAIHQALVSALRDGRLSMAEHEAAMERILQAKAGLALPQPPDAAVLEAFFEKESLEALSAGIAQEAMTVLSGKVSDCLPLPGPVWLFHPDRRGIVNYAFDLPTSEALPELLRASGLQALYDWAYWPGKDNPVPELPAEPAHTVVLVSFNPLLNPEQVAWARHAKAMAPGARFILVSAGTPYVPEDMPGADLHLSLCSYRPATIRALSDWLSGKAAGPGSAIPALTRPAGSPPGLPSPGL